MHILFIVPYAPNLIRVRPYNLIKALTDRGHQVTVATLWTTPDERQDVADLRALGVRVVHESLSRWRSLWNCATALPTHTPLQAVYCWNPALAQRLEDEIRNGSYDIVHVEHLRGARYGLHLKSQFPIPIIWDSVDCISYLFEQAARRSGSFFGKWITRLELPRTRRYEGWLVGQFDRTLVTSEVDKTALEELAHQQLPIPNPQPPITNHQSPITVLPNQGCSVLGLAVLN